MKNYLSQLHSRYLLVGGVFCLLVALVAIPYVMNNSQDSRSRAAGKENTVSTEPIPTLLPNKPAVTGLRLTTLPGEDNENAQLVIKKASNPQEVHKASLVKSGKHYNFELAPGMYMVSLKANGSSSPMVPLVVTEGKLTQLSIAVHSHPLGNEHTNP